MMPKLMPGLMMQSPMMQRPKSLLLAFFSITFLNASILGCAQQSFAQKENAQNIDCRSCHGPNGAAGAKDFSPIYSHPAAHHAVGVNYPLGASGFPRFNPPNGQNSDVAFFDTNGNGRPDIGEIQLFGTS